MGAAARPREGRTDGMRTRSRAGIWLGMSLWLATGCGQTIVLKVPDGLFSSAKAKPAAAAADAQPEAGPLTEWPFMTVMIDYPPRGNAEGGGGVRNAIARE